MNTTRTLESLIGRVRKLRPIFILILLSSFCSFSQTITLTAPSGTLCHSQNHYLKFSLSGEFPDDEEFALVQYIDENNQLELGKTTADSILITPTFSNNVLIKALKSGVLSNQIFLNVDAYPSVFLKYDSQPQCSGYTSAVEIYTGLQAGDQIQWKKDGELINGASSSIYNASGSGVYSSTIKRGNCSYEVGGKATVTIGSINKANLSTNHTPEVCTGYAIDIYGNVPSIPDLSYQWLYNGDTIAGAVSKNISAAESGDYQLVIQQGACVTTSSPMKVKIGSLKTIDIRSTPINQTNGELSICEGTDLQLNIESYRNRQDVKFFWMKDGEGLKNSDGRNITINEPGIYRYGIKQGECQVLSKPLKVSKGPIKGFKLQGLTGSEACEGQSLNLVPFVGDNDLTRSAFGLELYKDGQKLKDIPFIFDVNNVTQSGEYHIQGKFGSNECDLFSDTLAVTFHKSIVPIEIYSDINEVTSCSDSVKLKSAVSIPGLRNPNTIFQWSRDNQIISEGKEQFLIAKQNADYSLTIKVDSSCSYVSSPLRVSLNTFEASIEPLSTTLCSDHLNELTVKLGSSGKMVLNSLGESAYLDLQIQWYKAEEKLGTELIQSISNSGVYNADLNLGFCPTVKASRSIVLSEISKQLSPNQDTIGFCPDGGFVRIKTAEIASGYQWLNDSLNAVSNNFYVDAEKTGNYRVWIEKNGCSVLSNSIQLIEKVEKPTSFLSGDTQIEIGESADLSIELTGSAPWTLTTPNGQKLTVFETPYIWTVSPLQSTSYAITTVENSCGFGEAIGQAMVEVLVLGSEKKSSTIKVFPNPASEYVYIQTDAKTNATATFGLFDILGNRKGEGILTDGENRINLKNLRAGTYFLRVFVGSSAESFKIVKNSY